MTKGRAKSTVLTSIMSPGDGAYSRALGTENNLRPFLLVRGSGYK